MSDTAAGKAAPPSLQLTSDVKEKNSDDAQATELQQGLSPVDDEEEARNPRNWSPWKKRLMFFSLMGSSILADGYVVTFLR
ncbi:hypothetical protein P175DRAFT_0504677 [Aspergillus ochraceoroseus IBT 24754]|uniref:Uncharacterized protein n=1 Tax=Aspergillus ochraceoroseus IBT 24754 TaxID=1392256 RepID=A0A2T5LNR7_9EURO|nr:uncharacterized protein P175DRAFT_0504677 [Aspergillus ochraceoroseus IBT 24754]PTU17933.1 hypothetical protein P175DRAFT_0504677 [Aspergillus ochraceoroseus IBT 24754]